MAKEEKNKAELYREERKARIAKANKKNAKSIAKTKKAAGLGGKIIAVVLICAIIVGIGYWGVQTTGIVDKASTAIKVGDKKVSSAEYGFYYSNAYQQAVQYAQMMQQYGSSSGFNTDLAPDDPANTTVDENGKTITYAESFKDNANRTAKQIIAFCDLAEKAGFELSEEEKTQVEDQMKEYISSAEENGFSLNSFLKATVGPGFNQKSFKNLLTKSAIASSYQEKLKQDYVDKVSEKDIEAEYKANSKDYDYVDIRYYTVAGTTLTAKEGESDEDLAKRQAESNKETFKDAKDILGKITDGDSFEKAVREYKKAEKDADDLTKELDHTSYSSITSSLSEDVAKWVYDSARKAGDKKVFENEADAYVVLVIAPAYSSNSVDVRHCLVQFNAAEEGKPTDKEKEAAKKKADELLAEWKKGDKTEDSFAKLATENSDDTGSVENGGLYEKIRITDSYVPEFINWSFDSSRKAGDVDIIETEYGYHIMYFSKNNTDDLDWKDTIRGTKGNEAYSDFETELLADDGDYAVTVNEFWVDRASKKFCKKIRRNIANSASRG